MSQEIDLDKNMYIIFNFFEYIIFQLDTYFLFWLETKKLVIFKDQN